MKVVVVWLELPTELLIQVLQWLVDYSDCARFCLASPRVGLAALRHESLLTFKHPLFAVALRMETAKMEYGPMFNVSITEKLLRKYAADHKATSDTFAWIKRLSPQLYLEERMIVLYSTLTSTTSWFLVDAFARNPVNGNPSMTLVRRKTSDTVTHYEGEANVEEIVRIVDFNGNSILFDQGSRRLVCLMTSDKVTYHEDVAGVKRVVFGDGVPKTDLINLISKNPQVKLRMKSQIQQIMKGKDAKSAKMAAMAAIKCFLIRQLN